MDYYSAVKKNDFLKFVGKWIELGNTTLSEVTQSQNEKATNAMYSLKSGY